MAASLLRRRPHSLGTAVLAIVLLIAFSMLAASPADACSCLELDHWGFLAPENGRLPENAVGVAWHRPVRSKSISLVLAQVSVEMQQDGAFHQVPATAEAVPGFPGVFAIGPRDGFRVGMTYRFTDRGERRRKVPRQVLVMIDGARLEATTPLSLRIWPLYSETIRVAAGSLCSTAQWVAQALTEVTLPELASEWRDQLLYRTLVDGEVWRGSVSACAHYPPGRTWREVGEDLVYSACPEPSGRSQTETGVISREDGGHRGLSAAQHAVKVQAFLPGTDVVLETETLAVDLSCPGHLE